MTDESINRDVSQDQAPVEQAREEMMPKSRVADLIHERTKEVSQKSYEKGRAEAMAEFRSQPNSMGGMPQMSEDKVRQMMAEELTKQQNEQKKVFHQQQMHNLAMDFTSKIHAAKEKYPDLDKRAEEVGLANFAELVPLMNATDNPAGVLDDLINNPIKIGSLISLANRNPQLAHKEIQKLAGSIKQNEEASKASQAKDPLSQTTSSTIGVDNGSRSIRDHRSNPKYRG